jgi:hypothetical protein
MTVISAKVFTPTLKEVISMQLQIDYSTFSAAGRKSIYKIIRLMIGILFPKYQWE